MSALSRFGISVPLAAGVTFGVGVVMAALIAVEHSDLGDKTEARSFEINPIVDEIIDTDRTQIVEKFEPIDVPPPPPVIDTVIAEQPTERITNMTGLKPEMETPDIDIPTVTYVISDKTREPLVRIAPIMPPRAERSGHCTVQFSLDTAGRPFDIQATYCSSRVFERPTIRSVEKWKFNPTIRGGQPVNETGITNTVRFVLTDERGMPIPE